MTMIFKRNKKEIIDKHIPYYPYKISINLTNFIERFIWVFILSGPLSLLVPKFLIFILVIFIFTLIIILVSRFRGGLFFYEDYFEYRSIYVNKRIHYKEIVEIKITNLGRLFVENKILSIYYIPQDLISSNKKKSLGISNMYIRNLEDVESMINNKIKSYQ